MTVTFNVKQEKMRKDHKDTETCTPSSVVIEPMKNKEISNNNTSTISKMTCNPESNIFSIMQLQITRKKYGIEADIIDR